MIPVLDLGFAQIPTYFIVISLSISIILLFLSYRLQRSSSFKLHSRFDRQVAFDLALVLMVSGFIGGRLFHVFYEEFQYYKQDLKQILFFWNGGFVFLGGLIAAWFAAWLFCFYKKISFLLWADFFAPLVSLAHALGRIGCILSGCCFGTYCKIPWPHFLPWANDRRHPTATYLLVGELFIFLILLQIEKRKVVYSWFRSFSPFFIWVMLHSLLRFFVEFYRDDFRGRIFFFMNNKSLSITQVISLILIVFSFSFLMIQKKNATK